MKKSSLFLLIVISIATACAPQHAATPSPAPATTNTPPGNATLEPSQTLEPAPAPVQMTRIHGQDCPRLVDAAISDTGDLEVIYTQRGPQIFELPEGFSGFIPGDNNLRLWSWNAGTGKTAAFLLPSDAVGPRISADRLWIVFRRIISRQEFGETQSELWVIDVNGHNERKLAAFSFADVKARNRDLHVGFASVGYGWVPNSDQIYYAVAVDGADIPVRPPTYDEFVLVDVRSGKKTPLAQPGKAANLLFSPDGTQAAVLTDRTLNLVNTTDGGVQFTLPIPLRDSLGLARTKSLAYSPDGKYVIGFADKGVIRINTKDGTWRSIPLDYTVLTGEDGDSSSLGFSWVGNSAILVPLTSLPEGVSAINYKTGSGANPESSFTLWRVDLIEGTALPIQTFTGYSNPDSISPGGRYVAFQGSGPQARAPHGQFAALRSSGAKRGGGPPPGVILAEVSTGETILTIKEILFFAWSPYSDLFVYVQRGEPVNGVFPQPLYLGHIGTDPLLLENSEQGYPPFFDVDWVDAGRFVMDLDCAIGLITQVP